MERCTNRTHGLSCPPRVRTQALAPLGGCLPCVQRLKGDCPVRSTFGCSEADKADGIAIGRCVFEEARRQQLIEEHDRLLEWVAEENLQEFALAVLRAIDAVLYAQRARAWEAIVWNQELTKPAAERDLFGSPQARAARRYAVAGSLRLLRTYADLRPILDRIAVRRSAGAVAKAQAAARAILDEAKPGWEQPVVLHPTAVSA